MTRLAPLCRYCGEAIPKHTTSVYFRHESFRESRISARGVAYFADGCEPKSKEDAQRLVNMEVIAVRYINGLSKYFTERGASMQVSEVRHVNYATVWDGETYADQYFCSGDHARQFGILMAKEGHATNTYFTSVYDQRQKVGIL